MNLVNAQMAYNALQNAGLSDPVLSWALAQASFESTGFTSNVFNSANNASGIKWAGQKYGYDSTIKAQDGGTFTGYGNLDEWAKNYIAVLSLKRPGNDDGAPIEATDLNDYINRLKLNNYFGNRSSSDYYNGLQSQLSQLQPVFDNTGGEWSDSNQLQQTPGKLRALLSKPHTKQVAAIISLALIILIVFLILKNKKQNDGHKQS